MHTSFDVVVIGGGSGGLTSAVGLAKLGKRVLLIEQAQLGGECTNSGCIPSKALLHYAKTYHTAQTIAGDTAASETYRQAVFTAVRSKITEIQADETAEHFEKLGITVIYGEARFVSPHHISVQTTTYSFKKAIIATGSSPRPLSIPGLTSEDTLTNQNLFQLTTVPERLLIIGGGPIGMEMGQAFALLGSTVTLIENGPVFAKLEDEAIRPLITKRFTDLGITIHTNAAVESIQDKIANVALCSGEERKTVSIPFDKVLVAIGRIPNLPHGLTEAGIESTEFGITVNHNGQTTNRHVYALGDVAGRLKFTHVADDTARQVVAHLMSHGLLSVKEKYVPKVTYTDPEIAQVGLSFQEALERYGNNTVTRVVVPLSANDRARTDEATAGVLVVIARRLTGTILGAHMIGPRAGELIGTLTLAMENKISLYRLRSTIFAYPTYALLLKRAGDYYFSAQIQNLPTDLRLIGTAVLPKLCAALLWITALVSLYSYKETNGLTTTELSLQLFSFITTTVYGPLLYIIAYTIRPLTFFPGTALTILSGIFFGLSGILYTIIGANLSALLAYFVGRFFSSTDSPRSPSLFNRLKAALQTHPFLSILTMRLTFFPFDVVNYGAGLLRVPVLPYLAATFLGTLLGISTFVAIGTSLSVEAFINNGLSAEAIDTRFILLSVGIFIVSLLVSRLIKK